MSAPSQNSPIDPDRKGDAPSLPRTKQRSTTKLVWFLRLLPAILFAGHAYVAQGPFQSRTCLVFGRNCRSSVDVYMDVSINAEKENYYKPVIRYYKSLFQTHEDIGGSLSVFVNGRESLDVFAGSKDLEGHVNYDDQTLQQVYSSGKAIEGIVMARLVEKGLVDYDAPVSKYWPEFAVNGKENVRIVDVMTHESGVFFLDDKLRDLTWESLKDQAAFSARLAGQKHFFDGEIKRAYQAVSRGWYLNEIVRRVDLQGRTIGQIARQDLMTDYKDVELYYSHFDNDSDWEKRLSPMVDYPVLRTAGRLLVPRAVQTNKWFGYPELAPLHPLVWQLVMRWSLSSEALSPRMAPLAKDFRTKEAHATESTSFSLKTNAHSLAKLMSMMANKGESLVPGVEPDLLSRETYEKATAFHSDLPCTITFDTLPLSRGGWVKSRDFYPEGQYLKGVEVQGWGGAGGSLVLWIEELNIGFSYVTNAFGAPEGILGDFRGKNLLDLVVKARKQELGLLPSDNE